MQCAYYSSSVKSFIAQSPQSIIGVLAQHHPHDLDVLQRNSWLAQIELLQRELSRFEEGWIAFEFAIPRMGKRVDNIVIIGGLVFVLEFKVGADQVTASAMDQATDYALDLKNFHAGSHDLPIVPIVIATAAVPSSSKIVWSADDVSQVVHTNGVALEYGLLAARRVWYGCEHRAQLDTHGDIRRDAGCRPLHRHRYGIPAPWSHSDREFRSFPRGCLPADASGSHRGPARLVTRRSSCCLCLPCPAHA